ncbi:MAG: hypothetical protein A2Y77_15925 [Planctomycetes bacterium RBG_13_62_9]|nr:MAG: hypothetical protein A2Y77_15925 [Planctomycetes bacterium RBG_13_62_9]
MQSLGHGELANLKLGRTEIDDGSMLNTRGTQVTKRLGDVIFDDGFRRLDLKDELPVDNNVRDVLASDGPIFIVNSQWPLLLYAQASLSQPMDESVFIHLLQVPGPMITMDSIARFSNDVGQLKCAVFHNPRLQNFLPKETQRPEKRNKDVRGISLLFSPFFVSFGYPVCPFGDVPRATETSLVQILLPIRTARNQERHLDMNINNRERICHHLKLSVDE